LTIFEGSFKPPHIFWSTSLLQNCLSLTLANYTSCFLFADRFLLLLNFLPFVPQAYFFRWGHIWIGKFFVVNKSWHFLMTFISHFWDFIPSGKSIYFTGSYFFWKQLWSDRFVKFIEFLWQSSLGNFLSDFCGLSFLALVKDRLQIYKENSVRAKNDSLALILCSHLQFNPQRKRVAKPTRKVINHGNIPENREMKNDSKEKCKTHIHFSLYFCNIYVPLCLILYFLAKLNLLLLIFSIHKAHWQYYWYFRAFWDDLLFT